MTTEEARTKADQIISQWWPEDEDWNDLEPQDLKPLITVAIEEAVQQERAIIANDMDIKAQEHDAMASKHLDTANPNYSLTQWAKAAALRHEAAAILLRHEAAAIRARGGKVLP